MISSPHTPLLFYCCCLVRAPPTTPLPTTIRQGTRRACYEGLRSIGPFVVERFCSIVKLRNRLAHLLGYADYYDMKCSQAEGFDKATLFGILEPLEEKTRPLMERARAALATAKGDKVRNSRTFYLFFFSFGSRVLF